MKKQVKQFFEDIHHIRVVYSKEFEQTGFTLVKVWLDIADIFMADPNIDFFKELQDAFPSCLAFRHGKENSFIILFGNIAEDRKEFVEQLFNFIVDAHI